MNQYFHFIYNLYILRIIPQKKRLFQFYNELYHNKLDTFCPYLQKIIKLLKALYINFTDTISDYNLNYFSKKIERAPPTKFYFI